MEMFYGNLPVQIWLYYLIRINLKLNAKRGTGLFNQSNITGDDED